MQPTLLNPQGGQLSPREQVIAELAFKISATTLTNGARLERLRAYNLAEEEIHEVIKMADLFSYWQQRNRAETTAAPAQTLEERPHVTAAPVLPLPYFFEGNLPPDSENR